MKLAHTFGHTLFLGYCRLVPFHRGQMRIINWGIRKFDLCQPTVVQAKRNGSWFRLKLSDYLPVRLYYAGYHEFAETSFFKANLRPGDVFVDLGANIGYFTLLAARLVGCTGQVHAFEISPDDYQLLEDNLALNCDLSNVTTNRVAITAQSGQVRISETKDGGTTAIVQTDDAPYLTSVPSISLDEYVENRQIDKIDFIKCDIEGAELAMLRGAKSVLSNLRPVILLEINPSALRRFEATPREIETLLADCRYSIYTIVRGFRRYTLYKLATLNGIQETRNIVAIPRERITNQDVLPIKFLNR